MTQHKRSILATDTISTAEKMNSNKTKQETGAKFTTTKNDASKTENNSITESTTKFDPLLVEALEIGISNDNINETQSNITHSIASKQKFDNITEIGEEDECEDSKFTLHPIFHRKM